jgi:uncharacterized LabA/DUF88 family protein
MKATVFIDGENFQKKIKATMHYLGRDWDEFTYANIRLMDLLRAVLPDYKNLDVRYYVAKLHVYAETKEKSEQLVAAQRALKANIEQQGVEVVVSGDVRMFPVRGADPLFKEKGVDVRLAVDAVSLAADRKVRVAVLCSSDSDMQPVVAELRRRKVKVIYLGFQSQPNKGLMYTTDETVLIRNHEIEPYLKDKVVKKLNIRRFDEEVALPENKKR